MTELRALLETWSKHELYECQRRRVGSEVTFVVTVGQDRTLVDPEGKRARAYVLAAVIKAATARGWEVTLEILGGCIATVTRDPDNWSRNNIHPEARDTPAAALLAAYLKALEAEAGQ